MKLYLKFSILYILTFISINFADTPEEEKIRKHFLYPEVDTLPISNWINPTFEDYKIIQDHITNNFTQGIKRHLLPSEQNSANISDWDNPTPSDRTKLQQILVKHFHRTPLSHFKCFENSNPHGDHVCWWTLYRLGRCRIIDTEDNMPIYETVYINNNPDKKDKCVLCYASYPMPGSLDRNYPKGIKLMIEALKASNFDGHFIYRIGGWPNVQKGRLKYADVPYAFKPFFLEEARDLGYKKVLMLDASSMPVRSLDPIFHFIEKHGCAFFIYGKMNNQSIPDKAYILRSLGITKKNIQYQQIGGQLIGFDFSNKKASQLFDRWVNAAEKKVPFLSPEPAQFSLALLIYEFNLQNANLPREFLMEGKPKDFTAWKKNKHCIIYHQYHFLHPQYSVPNNLFN